MIKIVGILLIVASCSAAGISVSKSYQLRVDAIKSFINAFEIIKAEIVFKNSSVNDVINIITERCVGAARDYFGSIANNAEERVCDLIDLFQNDKLSLSKYKLKNPELLEIQSVLSILGKYDIHTQAEVIARGITSLEAVCKKAEEEAAKNGKLGSAFGITAGIVIAVLLL